MFDIGLFEVILIILMALVLIKPEDLPGLIRQTGRIYGTFRRAYYDAIDEIKNMEKEVNTITKPFHPPTSTRSYTPPTTEDPKP